MYIIQYNILDGCRDPERFALLNRWMSGQSYDIAGFNELNGWSEEEFSRYAKEWGFPFYAIYRMQSSGYWIGVMSRFPVETLKRTEIPFYHGLLHVKIQGVHLFLTHLSSADSLHREQEAELIAQRVLKLKDEPAIVMGDLNTLSPHDRDYYQQNGLADFLAGHAKLSRKFLTDGRINYRPMQILLDAGLTDPGAHSAFQYSVPTAMNQDEMHAAKLRLDYILVNQTLAASLPEVNIIQEQALEALSDHYPIECRFSND